MKKYDTKLFIRKHHPDAKMPTRSNPSDAGLDLYSVEEVTIEPGERKLVPVGINIVCDEGYFYSFAPRSSMAFKHNVIPSHFNVMDAFYTGDCSVLMHNRSDKKYTIQKGDKFCQIILHKVPEVEIVEIDDSKLEEIASNSRGDAGFGSSGK
jgi:dUTP pyrophosphatase